LIVVAFLFPLAVYCLVLGLINRRQVPLMVSAAWDFAGLLFATSGFLAFGLPGILSGFSEHGRRVALFGRQGGDGDGWSWLWELFEGLCSTLYGVGHSTVLLTYFAVVVITCAYVLWRRQGQTAIYNVYPEVLDEVLTAVLDAAGLTWSRAGNRYFIRRADDRPPPAAVASGEGAAAAPAEQILAGEHLPPTHRHAAYPASAEEVERSAYLEVDPAPLLCHVTLRWESEDEDLRKQIEGDLGRALAEVRTHHNPTALWLLSGGMLLLCTALMIFVMVIIHKIFIER
jgi:hypothetical protein